MSCCWRNPGTPYFSGFLRRTTPNLKKGTAHCERTGERGPVNDRREVFDYRTSGLSKVIGMEIVNGLLIGGNGAALLTAPTASASNSSNPADFTTRTAPSMRPSGRSTK